MRITTLVSCSLIPSLASKYAVKVVLTDTKNDEKNFDGTFYIKSSDATEEEPFYTLYKDESCETESGIIISLNYQEEDASIQVHLHEEVNGDWESLPSTKYSGVIKRIGSTSTGTWTLLASKTPFLDVDADDINFDSAVYYYQGNIKLYTENAVVLLVNIPN